jgi:DNA-binding transcriptional ArsR family regulator
MEEERALAAFAALSNPTRLKMIRLLVAAGPSGASAGDVAEGAGASPSRASFHLSALADAGLVTVDRQARTMIYKVSFEGLGALVAFLMEDCCGNDPQVIACCPPIGAAR